MKLIQLVANFHKEESGQDLVEYALVLAAIVLAVVAANSGLSGTLSNAIVKLDSKISSAMS